MAFRENLLKKIEINRLAHRVIQSINPTDSGQRIDRQAMEQLLEMGTYSRQKERDLDIYTLNNGHILVLDNELKIYDTTMEDVALRKSPTIKEMVSIRNAIKILNDKDVVISRKKETVQRVKTELIEGLDLSYTGSDIEALVSDSADALDNQYADGVIEILTLFSELLEFKKAPKTFQLPHHHIWGKTARSDTGETLFGPAVMYDMMHNRLKMCQKAVNTSDGAAMERYRQLAKGENDADLKGVEVLEALKRAVLDKA